MSSRRSRYVSMRSLAELQSERAKLNTLMKINEMELLDDADAVRQALDPSRLAASVLSKAYNAFPIVGKILNGYNYVSSFASGIFSISKNGCE